MDNEEIVILDAPSGTSCPVIETVKGSDYCLLVTESTPFGLNEPKLTVEMLRLLDISMGVLINRADVGTKDVENYCEEVDIPILLQIPLDQRIAQIYSEGMLLVSELPEHRKQLFDLFQQIQNSSGSGAR